MEFFYRCGIDGEAMDHLLLHCRIARTMRQAVLGLFRIHWVMPIWMKKLLACWKKRRRKRHESDSDIIMQRMINLFDDKKRMGIIFK